MYITVKTRRIAFLSYTRVDPQWSEARTNREGFASPDLDTLKQEVGTARSNADIVIVSIHDGVEYQPFPERQKVVFARRAVSYGADVVLGHHPHWFQGYEKHGPGLVCWSLGNCIFDQTWSEETKCGLLVEILIKDNKVQAFMPIPLYNDNYNFVEMNGPRRMAFLKTFTQRSFPPAAFRTFR